MAKKIWASTKITMHNLIYEIAKREVKGDYDGADALRDLFKHDLDKDAKEAIKVQKEIIRQYMIQELVYN